MPLDSIPTDTADIIETAAPAVATHRVTIREIGHNNRGPLYRVSLGDEVLITKAREPLCEAARALAARGLTGIIEMWRPGAATCAVRAGIETAAGLTVGDATNGAPLFKKWKPVEFDRDSAQDGGEAD